ncbi:MAG: hypothetical protein Q7S61_03120 [bacterium]|nr:hypothetical protein [bacterium]
MRLLLFVQEYWVILYKKVTSYFIAFPPASWSKGTKGDVILIPPFGTNVKFIFILGEICSELGYRVHHVPQLDNNTYLVEKGSKNLEKYIAQNNLQNVVLVSHSKGGLIAKYCLDFSSVSSQIHRSISVATPYQGTLWGYFYFFNLHEMIPGSPLLRKLNNETKNNHKIVAIFSKLDNHVIPNKNLRLEGATNIQLDIVGHTRILDSKELKEELRKILG